jgi:hypothetical protein
MANGVQNHEQLWKTRDVHIPIRAKPGESHPDSNRVICSPLERVVTGDER